MHQRRKTARRSRPREERSNAWLAFACVALSTWLWHTPARACKCAPLTPKDAYAQADAVFEGRVVEIQIDGSAKDSQPRLRVRFRTVRAWKGVRSEIVEVVTPSESAACGYSFERDTSYFVYSTEQDGILVATSCGRSRKMSEADDDLREHGMGATPIEVRTPPRAAPSAAPAAKERRGGCASCSVQGGAESGTALPAALALGLTLALVARATSRRRSGSRS